MKLRILFSIPSQSHVEIALDEMYGMEKSGYSCDRFNYAGKDGYEGKIGRLYIILINAYRLSRLAAKFQPDVIYFNSRLEVLAGIRDALTIFIVKCFYRRKVRFIIKSHGSDLEVVNDKQWIIRRIVMPYLRKQVDAWLMLSGEEKTELDKLFYFDPEKVWVSQNIIRTKQFISDSLFKQNHNIPPDHTVLLFSGRIIAEKGIFEVLNAVADLKSNTKITLIIVGSGNAMEEVVALCKSLNIDKNVIFTGFISEQKVIPYYSNCDILVFPTYFPEGFPMALFNSVSAGMCVITTPTRAAIDYLKDPQNCLWVKPQNSGSVTEALGKLLSNESLRIQMKKNNKEMGPMFSQARVCENIERILQKLIQLS
jgi:glycosyltransferase involved in cell wall biosynthesis